MKYKHSKEKQKEVLKKYELGGSTGLPAGAEQQFVNYYLNEGASVGVFANGGGVGEVKHFPLDKEKLNEDAKWYADRIKSGSMSTTKKSLEDDIEEYKKDLYLLEIGRKRPSNIIGTGYKGDTKKIAYTWLLEQIYVKNKILELLKDFNNYEIGGSLVDGYLTDPNFGDFQAGVYAQGGSLGNHGLKQGDQIIKTMSGGVQKVKTKSGDIVYVNLANGYRGAEPPLPFKNGGAVKKNLSRDRKFVNYSQDYEVRYSKDKPKRHGYTKPKMSRTQFEDESFEFFADGGSVETKVSALYSNYGFINDDMNWQFQLLEMLQNPSYEAYKIYQSLTDSQKEEVLQELYEMDNDMGMDGDGDIETSKENLEILLDDSKKAKPKFADGGLIGKEVTFMSQGEKDRGIIGEVNEDGSLAVDTGRSLRLVEKDEIVEIHDKPKKRGFFFADGGEIRRFNRHEQMDSETREEILDVVSEPNTPRGLVNYLYGLFDGYDYSKTANFKKEMEVLKSKDSRLHDRVIEIYKKIDNYKFEKQNNNYATGGVTKNYIDRNQLNTITIKKGDQKLTYKVSDVYNGAYKLEDGGNLEKMAFYVAKRNVVKVQLKNGKDVKVANGYWIKKGAKPIRASKFDDGGFMADVYISMKRLLSEFKNEKEIFDGQIVNRGTNDFKIENDNFYIKRPNENWKIFRKIKYADGGFMADVYATGGVTKNYIDRNQLNTITIKKGDQKLTYKVSDVYNGAYKLEDGGNLEKMAFYVAKRNVVKVQLKNGKDVKVANGYWIKKGAKPIRASKYDDGGQLEMKFAGGGKIETKIQKKVDEVNALIKKAIDSDGDPLMVVDTTGTWEEPMQYKPIVYKNGRLYIEYFEPYSGKTEKDVINKSNMDFDGYPTLLNIAKMYRKALKEKGISYAGGGDTKMVDGVMYEKVKFTNGIEDWYLSSDLHRVNFYCQENGLNPKNQKDFEKAYSVVKKYEGGGKTTFKEKATAIAKNFEGKKVKPKYQKEYGKTYDKAEAKEVGNKIAGSQKAKYDSKMSGGGKTKRGGAMVLAKQIRKEGESWASALKRANEQMRKK
jgi:hypothetical protein